MKFLSVLALASGVAAQASVVLDAVSSISDATTALQSSVEAFTGAEQAADLQAASEAVISAINDGNSAVEPIAELESNDALGLAGPVQDLADLTSSAVDATIAQRDVFVENQLGSVVLDQLTQIRDAASTFSETVLSKIPEDLRGIAEQISSQITDALNRGVEAFADQEGGGDDGGSSSGSDSMSMTSSGSATGTGSMSMSMTSATGTGGAPAPTGSGGAPAPTAAPTGSSPPISTGAAAANVANFGAAAAAALLVAAF